VPLADGTYRLPTRGVNGIAISIKNTFERRESIGSSTVHGDVYIHQGHGRGKCEIAFIYICGIRLTPEEFAEELSISPIWHFSPTGWNFILEELNRVIDLYRNFANAYWWQHLSMWNVDELKIFGRVCDPDELKLICASSSPKAIKFGGKPFEEFAYDPTSIYVKWVCGGVELPLYFLMYLNGRRSFVEHSFREALVNWANCVESYATFLLNAACKITGVADVDKEKILISADTYQKRYSKSYQILASANKSPTLKKKDAMKLIDGVMEYRNDVMHGKEVNIDWSLMGQKHDAITTLLDVVKEISI
jgi:hypothetical protein